MNSIHRQVVRLVTVAVLLAGGMEVSGQATVTENTNTNNNTTTSTNTNNNNNNNTNVNTTTSTNTNNNTNNNTNVNTTTYTGTNNNTSVITSNGTNTNTNNNTNVNTNTNNNTNNNTNVNTNTSVITNTSNNTNNSNSNVNSTSTNNNNNNSVVDSTSTSTNVNTSTSDSNVNQSIDSNSTATSTNTNINQSSSTSDSNVNSNNKNENVNTNNTTQNIKQDINSPPPSAIAPSIGSSYSQDLCTVGIGGAVQTQIFGFSAGGSVTDENCERIKLSKTLYDMGMKVAAVSLMCQDQRVWNAMRMAGTPCPYEGKIGSEADEQWKMNPRKAPRGADVDTVKLKQDKNTEYTVWDKAEFCAAYPEEAICVAKQ